MPGEAQFRGYLTPGTDSIRDAHLKANADIKVEKMRHAYTLGTRFGFAIAATPTSRHEIVHTVNAAGEVRGFHALLNATGSSTSIAFDLKKNGVSILSSVVTVTNSQAAREVVDGVLSSVAVVAGDVLSIEMTVSTSTGAQGPWAWVTLHENSAPN